ncbi:hypothetical protein [Halovenus carboxidivorans]|nr:hypothetical protein [Halovenus carboxidivorans]
MTLAEFGYCERCDARRELVPVAGGDALACCRCDAIVGGDDE